MLASVMGPMRKPIPCRRMVMASTKANTTAESRAGVVAGWPGRSSGPIL
jgi:hypothetical protein